MSHSNAQPLSGFALFIVFCLCLYGIQFMGAPIKQHEINYSSAALYAISGLCAMQLLIMALNHLAAFAEWLSAHQTTGRSGQARFAEYKDIKHQLTDDKSALFGDE